MTTHGLIAPEAVFTFIVPENIASQRIDRFIAEQFTHYSRTYFQDIISNGNVTINGKTITKQGASINPKDTITVQFPKERIVEETALAQHTLNISILATTEHFMIIHKPANLLVHAPSAKSHAITLIDWIRHHHHELSSVGAVDRPGIIHRLDKETSGLLIVTRTNYGHHILGDLFKNRMMHKTYKAVVAGHPAPEGIITFAIGRNPTNRTKMTFFNENCINGTGKVGAIKTRHAKTEYKVLEYFKDTSLIEVKPTTGRTHQIRVHMMALGHPIIGDQLYGKQSALINRQALHAEQLSFTFEDTQYSFNDKIPDDFQELITFLRTESHSIKKV